MTHTLKKKKNNLMANITGQRRTRKKMMGGIRTVATTTSNSKKAPEVLLLKETCWTRNEKFRNCFLKNKIKFSSVIENQALEVARTNPSQDLQRILDRLQQNSILIKSCNKCGLLRGLKTNSKSRELILKVFWPSNLKTEAS